jgi:RNA polymerase sigma-70 factor (ECF subfamily)
MSALRTTEVFVSCLSPAQCARITDEEALAEAIQTAIDDARAAWPGVAVGSDDFVAFLATKLGDEPPARDLARLRVGDLYLAYACGRGDRAALDAFHAAFSPVIERALRSRRMDHDRILEVGQRLREKLFVSHVGAAPRIFEFGGRAPLASWLRVAAVRTALHEIEKERRHQHEGDSLIVGVAAEAANPELALLKRRYAAEFRSSVDDALSTLETRDVNLLRQHYVDDLAMESMAKLYGVHRITIVRWVGRARELLVERTRQAMLARMGGNQADVDSVLRLIQSELDLSLRGLLEARPRP